MIVTDTNVVIRLLINDDPEQHEKARQLFASADHILIPLTVILETEWVLRFAYKFTQEDLAYGIQKLLGLPNVTVENDQAVAQALKWLSDGIEFPDGLHLAQTNQIAGIKAFATFDKKLIKKGASLISFTIQEPG